MADDNQIHDEYQLADLDGLDTEPTDTAQSSDEHVTFPESQHSTQSAKVRRNAIIAISIFILAIVIYKFVSSHATEENKSKDNTIAATTVQTPVASITPMPQMQPQAIVETQTTVNNDGKISQKLSALELSQQSIKEDFTSVNNQLGGINNSVNEMMTKMAEVSRVVANLSAIAEAQSREIERLIASKAKKVKQQRPPQSMTAPVKYYIQAAIPGRAWLMATNGNSITVRVGSSVSGYGVVKLIDAMQGRVMTSSGQTIRFSQTDS